MQAVFSLPIAILESAAESIGNDFRGLPALDGRIEAYGVRGMKSASWRKTFRNINSLDRWVEQHDAQVLGYRDAE
jgi:hypothetical protein